MKKIIEEGYYDTSIIGNSSVLDTLISENKVGVIYSYAAQAWIDPSVAGESALYAPVVVKTDHDFTMVVEGHSEMPTVSSKYVIPSTCQNVKAVVDILDVIYSYDFAILYQYGIKDKAYKLDENNHFIDELSYGTYGKDTSITYVPFAWLTYALPGNVLSFNTVEGMYSGSKAAEKFAGQRWTMEHPEAFKRIDSTQQLGLANAEEVEKLTEIEGVLDTYSTETITQLILGNSDIGELDSFINEMRSLGLDDFIAIYQAQHDRYMAAGK